MTTPSSHPAPSHLAPKGAAPHAGDVTTIPARPGASDQVRRVVRVPPVPHETAPGTAATAAVPPGRASRRRTRWFQAIPGWGLVALVAAGMGVTAGGTTIWAAWRAWRSTPVRRARTVIRLSRSAWRRYRRLRSMLGR